MRVKILILLLLVAPCLAQPPADLIDRFIAENQLQAAQGEIDRWMAQEPNNPEVHLRQGHVFFLMGEESSDPEEAARLRRQARTSWLKAKQLGGRDALMEQMLASVPEDGSVGQRFSAQAEAEQAMRAGEKAFQKHQWQEAIACYDRALAADPNLYEAALFKGDAYLHQGATERACACYREAVDLDPDRETAYRYWGNALLRQGDGEAARDRYLEAIVAEPYSRLAWERGLIRWSQATGVELSIPKIHPPTSIEGNNITVDPEAPALAPWLTYGLTRALWQNEKFAARYPGEPYRHSLAEEVEALSAVVQVAEELEAGGQPSPPDPDLALVRELHHKGLLEAFILLTRPDQGIVRDYEDYRRAHRARLVEFLRLYVIR